LPSPLVPADQADRFRQMLGRIEADRPPNNPNNNPRPTGRPPLAQRTSNNPDGRNGSASSLSDRIAREMAEVRQTALEAELENLQAVLLREKQKNFALAAELDKLRDGPAAAPAPAPGPDEAESRDEERETEEEAGPLAASLTKRNGPAPPVWQAAEALLKELGREFVFPAPLTDGLAGHENFRALSRRLHGLRSACRREIGRLVAALKAAEKEAERENGLRETTAALREELGRKNKLLTSLRAAKSADDNALELFKAEVRGLEENLRRLQRALAAKEAVAKDLRNKNEALAAQLAAALDPESAHAQGQVGPEANLFAMSGPELRGRVKELELERGRQRIRVTALKEKIAGLEQSLEQLAEEKAGLAKVHEKAEKLAAALGRKETQAAALQTRVDGLEKELAAARERELSQQAEAERRVRQLTRQIDAALRQQKELEAETALLRERVIAAEAQQTAHERIARQAHAQPEAASQPPRASQPDSRMRRRAQPTAPAGRSVHFQPVEPTDQSNPSHNPSQPPPMPMPAPEDEEAEQPRDGLRDVIEAINSADRPRPPPPAPSAAFPARTAAASDLLSRLTGLSSVLFAEPSLSNNPNPGSSSNPSDFSALFQSPSSASASQSASQLDSSASSSSASQLAASSVEKRLQALVSAALQSPSRPSLPRP
jgi:hypothetical protein